jgi:hypothetical protein
MKRSDSTDLTDAEWYVSGANFRFPKGGTTRDPHIRQIINAVFYVLKRDRLWPLSETKVHPGDTSFDTNPASPLMVTKSRICLTYA